MMDKLFGTDGIRGVANEYPMTPEMVLKIGRAIAWHFKGDKIVIGKDTRLSGDMIESALVSGICSVGVNPFLAGILPTPAIAMLAGAIGAAAGIVISASHNPFYDNGIKIFQGDGFKLSDDREAEIEAIVFDNKHSSISPSATETDKTHIIEDAEKRYTDFLESTMPTNFSLKGMKIVLDCSNGATCRVAPSLFAGLGAQCEAMYVNPDGKNINENCGSQHTDALTKKVIEKGADIGLAFDGDGDRLIAVDEKGKIVSGDRIIAICAKDMKKKGKLHNNCVVTTVMSNIGLGLALKEMGLDHVITDVGDRYVMAQMESCGAVLGGEDSGHIIFLDHHTTGDGMLTALRLIESMQAASKPLSELRKIMRIFPQVLINIPVKSQPNIESIPEIRDAIESVTNNLDEKGRVLVRYSGTQPKCRIMVEGPTENDTRRYCQQIADIVQEKLG
jgi:phosphoglucosamine mutase